MSASHARKSRRVTPSTALILSLYRSARPEDVREGRAWYRRARDTARELADQLDGDVTRAAAVLAVLSPLTPWSRNVQLARQAYAMARDGATYDDMTTGPDRLRTMGAHARKAAALVLGADPAGIVSGPKVTPFYARIVDAASGAAESMSPGSVVIDRHAHDIAVGRVTDDATRKRGLERKGGHLRFAMAYVRAAETLQRTGEAPGLTPSELQAVTWLAWRRDHAHAIGRAEARKDAAAASRQAGQ